MFGVQNTRTCPQKTVLEPPMTKFFFERKAHHRMRNEKLVKVTKFGDPRSINPRSTSTPDFPPPTGHGSSEGHEMLKRNDKCHSIVDDVPIPKNVIFFQNRSMVFFKNCTFVFDTIYFSLAAWLSPLLTRRPAFSSPTE